MSTVPPPPLPAAAPSTAEPGACDPAGTDGLPRPSDPTLEVWALLLRAHALVRRVLEDRVAHRTAVPLAELEVLLELNAMPDGQLRMAVLADRVLLSRSGLTRRIERLERLGLVERRACPNDARGAYAVITPAGHALGVSAAEDHLSGVREAFGEPLAAAEGLSTLRRGLTALIAAAEAQLPGAGMACLAGGPCPGAGGEERWLEVDSGEDGDRARYTGDDG